MDIKHISNSSTTKNTTNYTFSHKSKKADSQSETKETPAAVYEKSTELDNSKNTNKLDKTTFEKMKEEADKKTETLRNLVKEMLTKQGITFGEANYYQILREGNYEVTDEVRDQAQKDIAEDGYYGIHQTSERLVSFAKALSGGDSSKADLMIDSVLKGFEEATKTWGDTLPDISKKTLDATIEKLNAWKNQFTEE